MLVVVCPGQGAQSPGMLRPWLDVPGAQAWLDYARVATGVDLVRHGTESDAETIRDTAVAQPLLVASALMSLRALLDDFDVSDSSGPAAGPWPATGVDVVAGHSVGELAAAAVSGLLDETDALRLVAVRGRAMADAAAAAAPTGMSAVLGGDPDAVLARLAELGLTAANVNGGGQVVAAGALDRLAELAAAPPARARVMPLQVAGAFHTEVMAPAVTALADAAAQTVPHDPGPVLLGNADGARVTTAADGLARLVAQVARPVRWDLCSQTMADLGVTGLLELAPGGVLTGLARRTLPDVERVALKSPDDLDDALDLLVRHAGTAQRGHAHGEVPEQEQL